MKKLIIAALVTSIGFSACKKDPDETVTPSTPTPTSGALDLHIENVVGDSALIFNSQNYTNANGDTFTVSTFRYYISNIILTNSSGGTYTESESYHLVDAADLASCDIHLANVPFGNYTAVSFTIGVDSARNVSGAQTGALDPANGMFWNWLSGYIMTKFEGHSPQSTATGNALLFHCGGFSGPNSVLKHAGFTFGADVATVTESIVPEVHMKADVLEWFTSPTNISFATFHTVHLPGIDAKTIAGNYANMFSYEHLHN